ncbi:MAG: hypothetical protein EKK55_01025 [Rhodocyclaceae bacterium]|nr:MAG: hypothetical protein EKK55_01025 [Rhodocyclaceae bacterium]
MRHLPDVLSDVIAALDHAPTREKLARIKDAACFVAPEDQSRMLRYWKEAQDVLEDAAKGQVLNDSEREKTIAIWCATTAGPATRRSS